MINQNYQELSNIQQTNVELFGDQNSSGKKFFDIIKNKKKDHEYSSQDKRNELFDIILSGKAVKDIHLFKVFSVKKTVKKF